MKAERRSGGEWKLFPPPAFVCVPPSPLLLYIQVCPVCLIHASQSVVRIVVLIVTTFVRVFDHTSFYASWSWHKWHSKLAAEQWAGPVLVSFFPLERRKSKGGNGADQKHPPTSGARSHRTTKATTTFLSPLLPLQQNTFLPLFSPPLCVCGCVGHSSLRDGEKRREGNFLAQWTQGCKVPFLCGRAGFQICQN